jgi:hypothetical protein
MAMATVTTPQQWQRLQGDGKRNSAGIGGNRNCNCNCNSTHTAAAIAMAMAMAMTKVSAMAVAAMTMEAIKKATRTKGLVKDDDKPSLRQCSKLLMMRARDATTTAMAVQVALNNFNCYNSVVIVKLSGVQTLLPITLRQA